jgi:type VI secretion system secreted protein VgrG
LETTSDFLRVLRHEKSPSTANRQLQLKLSMSDDVLLPQRVAGKELICGGIEYRISCVASTPKLPLKELIARPAEISLMTDRGHRRRVCGIVTEAHAGDFDGGLAAYDLVVRDALAVMEKRTNSRVFRHMNELEIVKVLFDEWRHSNAVLAATFEYELDPLFDLRQYPTREQTMQCNESDAGFVRRLLKRRGIAWYVRPGRSRLSVDPNQENGPAHTVVLFNDCVRTLRQNAAGIVRYHREDATDQRDVITSWTGARSLQPGSITRHSWDYKKPLGTGFMTAMASSTVDQGSFGGQLAATLEDYLVEIPHAGEDVDDHWRLGQLRMQRHALATECFHGVGCVRDFCAGEYFALAGHPEVDTRPAADREFVIAELCVAARNNLPKDLDARAERLLTRGDPQTAALFGLDAGDADGPGRVQTRFTAVRRGVPIVPDFDPRADLPHAQMQSALVVGPPGEEVHCDALGRVKIRFPGMRAVDHEHAYGAGAAGTEADSAWVRVSSNWAGAGPGSQQQCGTLGLPRVGTEVLVAFLGGDPDRPIILSQLFNQRGEPPALSPLGGLPGNRHLSGMRSREVGGHRGNQLRFDDTRGQIATQLSSDHGASQLNLGWLTKPRANGAGAPRGEGAELRSDHAVAIRGGNGVLISAEAGAQAGDEQLERARLVGLTEVMTAVVDELARLAAEHGDDRTGRIAALVDRVTRWDAGSNVSPASEGGATTIVAVTAPAGIIAASADNVAIGSEHQVNVVSGGDTEFVAGRNLFQRAGRKISVFARGLGIKLVAGRGDVTLQANHGNVEVQSSARISLIAAEAIYLEAPVVRLVAGGAQTTWCNGSIVHQSQAKHVVRTPLFEQAGPGGANPAAARFTKANMATDERLVLRHEQTDEPIANQRYIAHLEDGRTVDGVTDERGRTSLIVGQQIEGVRFEILPGEPSN